MDKRKNKKGFTLAELLIVVAIIAVLVAIAIPVFTKQLEKSREATDLSNIRSAYAELVTAYLTDGGEQYAQVNAKQTQPKWQSNGNSEKAYIGTDIVTSGVSGSSSGSSAGELEIKVEANRVPNYYVVEIASTGEVKVEPFYKTP